MQNDAMPGTVSKFVPLNVDRRRAPATITAGIWPAASRVTDAITGAGCGDPTGMGAEQEPLRQVHGQPPPPHCRPGSLDFLRRHAAVGRRVIEKRGHGLSTVAPSGNRERVASRLRKKKATARGARGASTAEWQKVGRGRDGRSPSGHKIRGTLTGPFMVTFCGLVAPAASLNP